MNTNNIVTDAEAHMHKRLDSLKSEFTKLRTGRAHTGILEHVKVEYYGNLTQLTQVANITALDPRTLAVTPWEKTMVKPIEKAIAAAGLGLNPIGDANMIRIPMPPLTEERRHDLVKVVKSEAEQARIAVRNVRRDANNTIKDLLKKKEVSEDEERRVQDRIQKITDKVIEEIDKLAVIKEKELMEI